MNNLTFKVLRAGINTTFQDKGRYGLQHIGVTPGGCMDQKSFFIANALVGNPNHVGVLEFAYQGPSLQLIKGKTKIAITGDVHFKIINLNNEIIDGACNRTYNLNTGDKIDILATNKSAYGYFSTEGGFKLDPFFRSVSTLVKANIGPNNGNKIKVGDKIIINKNRKNETNYITHVSTKANNIIRVLKGPQYDYFSKESKKIFFSKSYKISKLTDRMGMRLEGQSLENIINTNIRSEGITKGAIQVPGDGKPIILLTDYPTIGGYPKIANIISADYDLLVQKKPGDEVSFKFVELHEAELLYKKQLNIISEIIKNIKEFN